MGNPQTDGSSAGTQSCFQSTHWTVVLAAGLKDNPESSAALQKLCTAYWRPLYAFIRRRGYTVEESEDLTQEFFARLLEKELLADVTREGGRFRSFLLTVLKRFLANEWNREYAQKRSGGKPIFPIDDTAEARYQRELTEQATPETLFERQWAAAVLDQVLVRLRDDYAAAGKQALFEQLQSCLPGAQSEISYAQIAATFGMNESAVRMAAHRLRRRYGELLRAEIAVTVSSPEEIDEEIRYLIALVGHQ
jgi:RNA polymerase sigma-70 factor (ECF subfamily)